MNLAEPFVAFSEPVRAEDDAAGVMDAAAGFTIWDKVVVDGAADLTMRGLVSFLKKEKG